MKYKLNIFSFPNVMNLITSKQLEKLPVFPNLKKLDFDLDGPVDPAAICDFILVG